MKMKKMYILLGLMALVGKLCYGQLSEGGKPFSPGVKLKSGIRERLIGIKKPNIDSLLNHVETTDKKRDIAAVAVDLDLDILERGISWEYQEGKVFELSLQTPDASGLIVHFSEFHLPVGAKVFVFNNKDVLGAFTHQNNKSFGSLTLQELKGNKATIQLVVPKGKESQVKLKVGNVGYGFTKRLSDGDGGSNLFGASLPCNHDINSKMGVFHQKEKRSVVLMIHLEFQFYVRYSAVLVNNYKNDGTPYFLTAKHCFEKVFSNNEFHAEYAETAVTHFGYESLMPGENGNWSKTISGAEILCYDPTEGAIYHDLVLMKFDETPPAEFEPYYSGVTAMEPEINDVQYSYSKPMGNATYTSIHHPKGDVKKITWYERVETVNNGYVSISDIDGVTEQGSSGSPLFDRDHYVVGVLHGGSAGIGDNMSCGADYKDTYYLVMGSEQFIPALQDSLFGNSGVKRVNAFEPFGTKNELLFYPNSIKIDHDEEKLLCKNVSSANYSNFRWDFGEGAEPRTFTGAEPPEIQLQELGFYALSLTAFNSLTGEDETLKVDSIIQCRYGKAYPCFVITDREGFVTGQAGSGINKCEFTDTLYLLNTSYGAANEYIFTISGNKTFSIKTSSKDDIIKIPAFGASILETERDYNYGKQVSINLLQKHPERDTSYEDLVSVFEPTIAAFEVERINHFGRDIPDYYYLVNETEVFARNKSTGHNFKCRWYVNDELTVERNRASDYSWMPEQPGLYEMKLIISNDFSADTAKALFDFHLKTAVEEFSRAELKVYPTLCHNSLTIQNQMEGMQLEVYDITGKIIQEQHLSTGQKTLDVSALKSGIYLFNFYSARRQKTIKIIKQ